MGRLLPTHERLRRLYDHQCILQRLTSQAPQRREDPLYSLFARPSLGQFDQHDARMRGWKLARVTFEIVVLGDERRARSPRIGEHIGVRAGAQPDIVGVFRRLALAAEVVNEPRRQIFVHEETPARGVASWRHRPSWT